MKTNGRFAFFAAALACAALSLSCKDDLLDEPSSAAMRGGGARMAAPSGLSASQGKARAVDLEWTAIDGADSYEVLMAPTPFDDFIQIAQIDEVEQKQQYSNDGGATWNDCSPDDASHEGSSFRFKNSVKYTDIGAKSGQTRYYRVRAVKKTGAISPESAMVKGSVLAVPQLYIDLGDESSDDVANSKADTATVTWYMDNDADYKNFVTYTVSCCATEDANDVLKSSVVKGSDGVYSCKFTGLTQGKSYWYQVVAQRDDDQGKSEKSELMDMETARRLIPPAPKDLRVEQGLSTGGLKVSWELPEFAWTKFAGQWEKRPVYFTLRRRLESEGEGDFVTLRSYIGCVKGVKAGAKLGDGEISFDCAAPAARDKDGDFADLSIEPGDNGDADNSSPDYKEYIYKSRLTYSDGTAERGKKYVYEVQSYTDDNDNKAATSGKSKAAGSGHLIGVASLRAMKESVKDDNDASLFKSSTVTFDFKFDPLDVEYVYVLHELKTCVAKNAEKQKEETEAETTEESAPGFTSPKAFNGLRDVNDKSQSARNFTFDSSWNDSDNRGYYRYSLDICVKNADGKAGAVVDTVSTSAPNTGILITSDPSCVPTISDFNVADGYKDKFVITWTFDASNIYTLSRDGGEAFELSADSGADHQFTYTGSSATYEDPASSGDARVYTLTAIKRRYDPSDSSRVLEEFSDSQSAPMKLTLGTPALKVDKPDYSKIELSWPAVQGAGALYKVTASYADSGEAIALFTGDSHKNDEGFCLVHTDESGSKYSCSISKPSGWNDAALAGKEISISVTAESAVDTTTAVASARLLGPACADLKVAKEMDDPAKPNETAVVNNGIKARWRKVDGAAGYLVYRAEYEKFAHYGESGDFAFREDSADKYWVDGETGAVEKVEGDGKVCAQASFDGASGFFTLFDSADGADEGDDKQLRLQLGVPFGYFVVPLKEKNDAQSFELEAQPSGLVKFTEGSIVPYVSHDANGDAHDVDLHKGAARGYGLNVRAAKCESMTEQRLEWDAPYYNDKAPAIYRREMKGNSARGGGWAGVSEGPSAGASEYSLLIDAARRLAAYEYALMYRGDGKISDFYTGLLAAAKEDRPRYAKYYADGRTEQKNKGYLFAIDSPFKASCAALTSSEAKDYYAEKFGGSDSDRVWDVDDRMVCPDSPVALSLQNLNRGADYKSLGSFSNDGVFTPLDAAACSALGVAVEVSKTWASGAQIVRVSPAFSYDSGDESKGQAYGYSNGMLQVLRDWRHHYRLTFRRELLDDNGEAVVDKNDDAIVLEFNCDSEAYRNVTDAELVKAVMLIIGQALEDTNIRSGDPTHDSGITPGGKSRGDDNSFYAERSSGITNTQRFEWQVTNYTQVWKTLPGESQSAVSAMIAINDPGKNTRGHRYGKNITHLCATKDKDFSDGKLIPMNVSGVLPSCDAVIKFGVCDYELKFRVSHDGKTTMTKDLGGTKESDANRDAVRKWSPIRLHDAGGATELRGDNYYYGGSDDRAKKYGWWPN